MFFFYNYNNLIFFNVNLKSVILSTNYKMFAKYFKDK